MIISEPESFYITPQISGADLDDLPNISAVYLLWPRAGVPYLSRTAQLRRRLKRILYPSAGMSSFSDLRAALSRVEFWPYSSRLEGSLIQYFLARQLFADDYRKRLKLRLSHFVQLTADPFPRLAVTTRLSQNAVGSFGPFRSRDAAEKFEQECLTLFQIRRCTETLQPQEDHPGCIYGEMNLCLRPCQLAVSVSEYGAEVKRVSDFLSNSGKTALVSLSTARETASDAQDFEQAASIHKQIEKITAVLSLRDALVTSVESLHGLAIFSTNRAHEATIWPMLSGFWQRPVTVDLQSAATTSLSLDYRLRQLISNSLAAGPVRDGNRAEQISILSRWYYSSWRDGEWLPFESPGEIEYRKLVRALSKLQKEGQAARQPARR